MTFTLIQHRVADYDAWRRVYDSVGELQRDHGVTADAVYRAEGDPNSVLVMHKFDNAQQAHAFFEIPELAQAMQDAGVERDSVRLEFYDQA